MNDLCLSLLSYYCNGDPDIEQETSSDRLHFLVLLNALNPCVNLRQINARHVVPSFSTIYTFFIYCSMITQSIMPANLATLFNTTVADRLSLHLPSVKHRLSSSSA
jgi:hypothetical protein